MNFAENCGQENEVKLHEEDEKDCNEIPKFNNFERNIFICSGNLMF